MFQNIDKNLKKIGFIKIYEDKYSVSYERYNKQFKYTQVLDIIYKKSGNHLIQSYQKGVNTDGFNNVVGLTYKEMKLAMKKYRQMKGKYGWK